MQRKYTQFLPVLVALTTLISFIGSSRSYFFGNLALADDSRRNPILEIGFEISEDEEEPPAIEIDDVADDSADDSVDDPGMCWQVLPAGLMYKSYLAGEKEPRFQAIWLSEKRHGLVWETSLGGRVGLIRHGTQDPIRPQGWQLDLEGAAQARVLLQDESDLEAVDFRFGMLSTWRRGGEAFKFGYYHLSSHLGDEFLIKNIGFQRLNYVRDSAIVGWTHDLNQDTQIYGEVAYALGHEDGALPWEFQYGVQYSPLEAFGLRGAPYLAVNGHTREDEGFATGFNTVAGWQWRGDQTNHLFRVGFQYYTGPSVQYSFVGLKETLVGGGIWFDY